MLCIQEIKILEISTISLKCMTDVLEAQKKELYKIYKIRKTKRQDLKSENILLENRT